MPTTKPLMIHAPALSTALQCPKKALCSLEQPGVPGVLHPSRDEYFRQLDALLAPLNLVHGEPNDSLERSLQILRQEHCGRNLRFQKGSLRTKIPLLFEKEDGTFKAVYPVCSTSPKDSLLSLLFCDRLIAKGCGVEISEWEFLFLNKKAVRRSESRPADFFVLSSRLKKAHGGFHSRTAAEMLDAMTEWIEEDEFFDLMEQTFSRDESEFVPRRIKACTSPSRCSFYEHCWHEDSLPDDSALLLTNSAHRLQLAEDGIESLDQIDGAHFEGGPMQYAQIQAARFKGMFLDRAALGCWMNTLTPPLNYLDFEWETFALPPYEGMKPFGVLCFQYSLHTETEKGLVHHSFFSTGDCRRAFIEQLLADLPSRGSILVFNLEGAEKLRLMELAEQFEEYRRPLEEVCSRMVDLALPFESGACYLLGQRGKSSLKTLLPLFSDHDGYRDLAVHNGMEAVLAYRQALACRNLEQMNLLQRQIEEYCAMDTYAERELFLGLCRLYEEGRGSQALSQNPDKAKTEDCF